MSTETKKSKTGLVIACLATAVVVAWVSGWTVIWLDERATWESVFGRVWGGVSVQDSAWLGERALAIKINNGFYGIGLNSASPRFFDSVVVSWVGLILAVLIACVPFAPSDSPGSEREESSKPQ